MSDATPRDPSHELERALNAAHWLEKDAQKLANLARMTRIALETGQFMRADVDASLTESAADTVKGWSVLIRENVAFLGRQQPEASDE